MGRSRNIALILSCLFFACTVNAQTHEVQDESEFSYHNTSTHGPHKWGTIHPEWSLCGTGKFQSPVDLRLNERVVTLSAAKHLKFNFKSSPAIIRNRGHDIMVRWEGDAGGIEINGTKYRLEQAHWHTPAEHTSKGRRSSMELHMVHYSEADQDQLAVVGILYKLGRPDPFLKHLLDEIRAVNVTEIPAGQIDPNEIGFRCKNIYRYKGSLTVPPCTEGVTWSVLRKRKTVSMEQIHALREAVHDGFEENARPVQK